MIFIIGGREQGKTAYAMKLWEKRTLERRKTKDLSSLQKLLGHSNIRETMIYAHVMDESKREGMQCFNSFTL